MSTTHEIHHVACQAVLAMAARAVASNAFNAEDEIRSVQIIVRRVDSGESEIEVEFFSAGQFPVGGYSL